MSEVASVVARAEHLIRMRRLDDARSEVATALASSPNDSELLTMAAYIELEAESPQQVSAAEAAVAADPTEERNYRILAAALRQVGRSRDAVETSRTAVRLAPDLAEAHVSLAASALSARAWKEGRESLDRALVLDPNHTGAIRLLAESRMAARDPKQAEVIYRDLLARDPNDARALDGLGRAREAQGDKAGARQHFVQASAADPHFQGSRDNLVKSFRRIAIPGSALSLWVIWRIASAAGHDHWYVAVIILALIGLAAWFWVRHRRRKELETIDAGAAQYVSDSLRSNRGPSRWWREFGAWWRE